MSTLIQLFGEGLWADYCYKKRFGCFEGDAVVEGVVESSSSAGGPTNPSPSPGSPPSPAPAPLSLTQEQLNSMFAKNRKGLTTLVETQKGEIESLKTTMTDFMETLSPTMAQLTDFFKTKPTADHQGVPSVDDKKKPKVDNALFDQQSEQFKSQFETVNQQLEEMKKVNVTLQKEIESARKTTLAEKKIAQEAVRDSSLAAVLGPLAVDPLLVTPFFQSKLSYDKPTNLWVHLDPETDEVTSLADFVKKNLPASQRKASPHLPGPGGRGVGETVSTNTNISQIEKDLVDLKGQHNLNPLDHALIARIGSKTRELTKLQLQGTV